MVCQLKKKNYKQKVKESWRGIFLFSREAHIFYLTVKGKRYEQLDFVFECWSFCCNFNLLFLEFVYSCSFGNIPLTFGMGLTDFSKSAYFIKGPFTTCGPFVVALGDLCCVSLFLCFMIEMVVCLVCWLVSLLFSWPVG